MGFGKKDIVKNISSKALLKKKKLTNLKNKKKHI
jgi:hypothetical protein